MGAKGCRTDYHDCVAKDEGKSFAWRDGMICTIPQFTHATATDLRHEVELR